MLRTLSGPFHTSAMEEKSGRASAWVWRSLQNCSGLLSEHLGEYHMRDLEDQTLGQGCYPAVALGSGMHLLSF